MKREDLPEEAKKEFEKRVNARKGDLSFEKIVQTTFLTDSQKKSWNESGFILCKELISEEDCKQINHEVSEIIHSIIKKEDEFSHAYGGDGKIAIREMKPNEHAKTIEDEMSKLFRIHSKGIFNDIIKREEVINPLRDILGENIDCFLSQFIFKNPGAWGQPWHQDSSYFNFNKSPQVGVWIATSEATLENGCLVILPGSHKEPLHEHLTDERPGANYGYTEIKDHDFSDEEPLLLKKGDVLFFHSFLMHKSYDNKSSERRTAMVYHFAESDTKVLGLDSPTNEWVNILRNGERI
tara:strand:+ start:2226 stop:3110 length:885 start_codon:yes stop_codon:yes gene_type:complete